jgi:hypothetical protein
MAGLVARTIAPPPTENEVLTIKDRIKRLDPSLITDVYTISQIIQSPELMAYIKSLYEHVKNNIATNKDLQYILNIVKPIIDYISINSDKFNMSSSPWLMEVYSKIKGTTYIPPIFTPETPQPQPITTAPTTFNFQSDSTAPPTERHAEAPAQNTPIETMPQYDPESQSRAQYETSPPIRRPLAGNMPTIYNAYTEAFKTRQALEQFYTQLLSVPSDENDSFMQIRRYITQRPITPDQMTTTPTATLTTNLIGAIENTIRLPQWAMQELQTRADQINNDPSFFFQSLTRPSISLEQPQTKTENYEELKLAIYRALESRTLLEEFIVKLNDDTEFLKQYQIFKNYIINESNKLTGQNDIFVNEIKPKILFDLIYNGLVSINNPILNSDFIPSISNQMERLISDPKFEGSDKPFEFTTTFKRLPLPAVSELGPKPLPTTVSEETRPTSIPQMPTVNNTVMASPYQPIVLSSTSKVGQIPLNKTQILSIKMKQKETANKLKEFVKEHDKKMKLGITEEEAIKITTKILENSKNIEDVSFNLYNVFDNILNALSYSPYLTTTIIAGILKLFTGIRGRTTKYSEIPKQLITDLIFDFKIVPKSLAIAVYEFSKNSLKGNFKNGLDIVKIIYDAVRSDTVEIANNKLKNINKDIVNAMEQGLDVGRAEGEALQQTEQLKKSFELEKKILERQKLYLNDIVIPSFNELKQSINIENIKNSFEEYKQFYIKIQKFTSQITLWLREIGAGNSINITPLAELDVSVVMPSKKLLANFNSKDFKTVWSRLEKIYNLNWDVSNNRDYQDELNTFSKELTDFLLLLINKLRYQK